jgi:parallel beta-helix repeat protein
MMVPPRPAVSRISFAAGALIASSATLLFTPECVATTRRVPSEYSTIQAAIDASLAGDSVLVAPGTYRDRSARKLVGSNLLGTVVALAFLRPGVALVSESGAGSTTLDGLDETVEGVVIFGGKMISVEGETASPAAGPVPDLGDPRQLREENREEGVAVEVGRAWFPEDAARSGDLSVREADVAVSGNDSPVGILAALEGFTIVNTRYTVYVADADVRVASNVFTNGIWVEGNATGLFEQNRMSRGGLYCAARGPVGPTWRENEFQIDAIDLGCRCRQALWEGNTFANRGRTLFVWALAVGDFVKVIGNTFEESFFDGEGGRHIIKGNVLLGPGYGVGLFYLGDGIVEENIIEDYSIGLDGSAEMRYNTTKRCATGACVGLKRFHHNTILDSDNFGIRGFGREVIEDNEVRGSRLGGIWLEGANASTVRRNLVWENGNDGISVSAGLVEGNVVVMNGGNGICRFSCGSVARDDQAIDPIQMRGNTIAFNGEGGIRFETGTRPVEISRNIIAFSGGEGLVCGGAPPALEVFCNDSFGNEEGDYTGLCVNLLGIDGNLSEDPMFCNPPGNDFRIAESSPCAPRQSVECGLIGALDPACLTPVSSNDPRSREERQVETSTWGQIKTRFVR